MINDVSWFAISISFCNTTYQNNDGNWKHEDVKLPWRLRNPTTAMSTTSPILFDSVKVVLIFIDNIVIILTLFLSVGENMWENWQMPPKKRWSEPRVYLEKTIIKQTY